MKKTIRILLVLLLCVAVSSCTKPYNTESGYDISGEWYSDQIEMDTLVLAQDLSWHSEDLGTGTYSIADDVLLLTNADGLLIELVIESNTQYSLTNALDIPVSWFRTRLEAVQSKQIKLDQYGIPKNNTPKPEPADPANPEPENPDPDPEPSIPESDIYASWNAERMVMEILTDSTWEDFFGWSKLSFSADELVATRRILRSEETSRYRYTVYAASRTGSGYSVTLTLTDVNTDTSQQLEDIRMNIAAGLTTMSGSGLPYGTYFTLR